MEEYTLALPAGTGGSAILSELPEFLEPIAEHNFNRKKLLGLEQGLAGLQKTARQQHEVTSQLQSGLRSMISDTDLRRALGLAFQEFERRLEDAFTDSNRRCLAMFSKREEMQDLQGLLGKKVNWTEHNAVLKKLADLRLYIDTMAESVFIGHRDALNSEFAKKADASSVDQALKAKADLEAVNEVRARLERLEVLVAHTDARQSAKVEALRTETEEQSRAQSERQLSMIAEHATAIGALREQHSAVVARLGGAEAEVRALATAAEKLREVQRALQENHERVVTPSIAAARDQLQSLDASVGRMGEDLRAAAAEAKAFRANSEQHFGALTQQANTCKEQLEFLMEATEMIKRRSREATKGNTAKFKELTDDQERTSQQLAALERQIKRHERDVRAIENRTARAEHCGALSQRALMAPEPELSADPNERLKSVLEQLERIAGEGAPIEQADPNPARPPLPFGADMKLPRFNFATEQAPIDSARNCGTVNATYGLSPRGPPGGVKAAKKKR